MKLSSARILIFSFLITIIIGTGLLALPLSSASGKSIGILNALFTSTSAVCVTGLIVLDTAKDFSRFGQIIILILIQLGGLGIMTFSSAIFLFLKGNLSLKEKLYLKEGTNNFGLDNIGDFLKNILLITFIFETIGAIFLYWEFSTKFPTKTAIFHAIFHSISAFCNAGFSTFSNSLVDYKSSVIVNLTISFLIIFGGLGFLVFNELLNYRKNKKLSLHSKIVLISTIFLIILGTILIFIFEYHNFAFNWKTKILSSFFQSVTTRTAGFNTIDLTKLTTPSIFLFIILMIIGASPGSTGGGIKTTTFSLLILSIWSSLKKKSQVIIAKSTVREETVKKSFLLISIYLITASVFLLLLFYLEPKFHFKEIIFELFSALGTVGLSLGITAQLSSLGKIIIILAMFIGRVGPLTLVSGITIEKNRTNIKFPEERVSIG